MEAHDNTAAILHEIEQHTEKEIAKLRQEHDARVEEARKASSERLARKLKALSEEQEQELARVEKQRTNSFELEMGQELLQGQYRVYGRVMEGVLEQAMKDKALLKTLQKRIEQKAGGKLSHFLVPRGSGLSGKQYKAQLDEAKIIAVLNSNEEMEFGVKDLLRERAKRVHDLIAKELY